MANNNKHTGPNVPALRFPEFSGEWSKDCLNEFLEVQPARNTQGIYSKDDVLSVSGDYGVVNQIKLLGRSFAGKDVSNYHIVRTNDIVYTKSPLKEFPYGIVKTNQGTAGIVSTLYAVYSAKSNTDPKFVEYYFSSKERTNKYFKPIVRIGAKHDMKIGNEEVLRNIVVFPSKQEQNKIQEFLRIIDERIATQSKIIEELNTLRSALIEEVFQSPCDTIAIGSVAYQTLERNRKSIYTNVLSVSNRYGFINQSEQFEDRNVASDDVRNYKIVRNGDFAYNPARINVGSIAMLRRFDSGIVSPMYVCFRIDTSIVDPSYFELFLKSRSFKDEMEIRLEGSVRRCLSFDAMREIHIPCPDIKDQCTIAENIGKISSKLELEEGILAAYADQKAWLLNQMFI